ncbi:tRNA dimethylallyltransferase [Malonomonas rubra DSM 5091]|uniref:tRNA dimethylallyltransferase n=1 Tax=Malonomonas rubra DSM 5091 TaxID=1122189 RepID=A0A1M6GB49_MALRU|nr:tRNA (adenosine(37)-N6)-dimethylallyltransferase MiaA [Malonomonas rubra]SHJ07097.1 tRNA dimethylallyltransferase [Malonomonas rubra DSM 5091]
MQAKEKNLLVILGATAGGKTGLAVQAAKKFECEIISADSRQVYRGMDLGTGKDLDEYGDVPYHLIDIAEPGSEYNVFQFQRDCFAALEDVWQRDKLPIICGGTGMYLDAVLRGYRLIEVPENRQLRSELQPLSDKQLREKLLQLKPEQHNRTDLDDRPRLIRAIEIALGEQAAEADLAPLPELRPLVFGLRWPREVLRQRIATRLMQRFDEGMIEEVQQLHDAGVAWESLEFYGLEYRLIAQHLQGKLSRNDMVQKLRSAIGQFAKRQETFFRRMERNGVDIFWLEGDEDPFARLCEVVERCF